MEPEAERDEGRKQETQKELETQNEGERNALRPPKSPRAKEGWG